MFNWTKENKTEDRLILLENDELEFNYNNTGTLLIDDIDIKPSVVSKLSKANVIKLSQTFSRILMICSFISLTFLFIIPVICYIFFPSIIWSYTFSVGGIAGLISASLAIISQIFYRRLSNPSIRLDERLIIYTIGTLFFWCWYIGYVFIYRCGQNTCFLTG